MNSLRIPPELTPLDHEFPAVSSSIPHVRRSCERSLLNADGALPLSREKECARERSVNTGSRFHGTSVPRALSYAAFAFLNAPSAVSNASGSLAPSAATLKAKRLSMIATTKNIYSTCMREAVGGILIIRSCVKMPPWKWSEVIFPSLIRPGSISPTTSN